MSIYATAFALDGDDLQAPIVYQRSHVLPSDDDARAGSLLLCQIPGFISRTDRTLCGDDQCGKPDTVCCDRVWPYLRLSLHGPGGDATVVLDHAQVQEIHAYLGRWLEQADPKAA